mgnify:CR=1 FL=1|jgi:hypothetical protein
MENLDTKAILLDMTTDLSRVGNFTLQKKDKRARQFTDKIEQAIKILKLRIVPKNLSFLLTKIEKLVVKLKQEKIESAESLADEAFTYGNILSHRASKLVS